MKRFLPVLLSSLLLSYPVSAQTDLSDKYASISDIPLVMRQRLSNSRFLETYIDQQLAVIRENAHDKRNLTPEDIKALKSKKENQARHEMVSQAIRYDQNFDGIVSKDEIMETLEMTRSSNAYDDDEEVDPLIQNRNQQNWEQMANGLMEADQDGDGKLTIEEMSKSNSNRYQGSYYGREDLDAYLALDPDKDGKLTIPELTELAQKAFNTIDKNSNGFISQKERKELDVVSRKDREERVNVDPACTLPSPAADEKLVFIGVYEGKSVSTMSVAGQVTETDVIPVYIPSGAAPIYIVAASFKPIIWQLKGATERVAHVALAGPSIVDGGTINAGKSGKINAGVIGVAADKVSFRHAQTCGLNNGYEQNKMRAANAIKVMTGKMPDIGLTEYGVVGIHINADSADSKMPELVEAQKKTPAGFDGDLWQRHLIFMPGGLIDVSKEKIVSDAPVVAYQVLPKWAGLAKLKADGAIIYNANSNSTSIAITENDDAVIRSGGDTFVGGGGTDVIVLDGGNITVQGVKNPTKMIRELGSNSFKIVKDIPYYPSGLYGGFSADFVIAKGVKPPKGDPGHSCVRMEETDEPIEGSRTCH